jgi:hypothetical protein
MIGNTSTIGLKAIYASGKRDNNKVSNKNPTFNNYNSTIKVSNFLIYINV